MWLVQSPKFQSQEPVEVGPISSCVKPLRSASSPELTGSCPEKVWTATLVCKAWEKIVELNGRNKLYWVEEGPSFPKFTSN